MPHMTTTSVTADVVSIWWMMVVSDPVRNFFSGDTPCVKTDDAPKYEDGVLVCGPGQHGVWPTKCSVRCWEHLQGIADSGAK